MTPAAPVSVTLTSKAFGEGGAIPRRFTCEGDETAPPLEWSGLPAGRFELAVVDLLGGDDHLHAVGDALNGHGVEPVAVASLVLAVERDDHRGDSRGVQRAVRDRNERRLPALTEHPGVERAYNLGFAPRNCRTLHPLSWE